MCFITFRAVRHTPIDRAKSFESTSQTSSSERVVRIAPNMTLECKSKGDLQISKCSGKWTMWPIVRWEKRKCPQSTEHIEWKLNKNPVLYNDNRLDCPQTSLSQKNNIHHSHHWHHFASWLRRKKCFKKCFKNCFKNWFENEFKNEIKPRKPQMLTTWVCSTASNCKMSLQISVKMGFKINSNIFQSVDMLHASSY